ncbi:MAG: periplasmic sensor signal transduction histidine kinase [Herbaspirillum sp.]|jgi:two-component system sensor histidine kinase TctE|nr:periplasmic sensor signal transduction histidine kinase [Herbaspirillum sp.]
MKLRSLRAQLLAWLLVPLAFFVAFNSWVAYRNAFAMATVVHDRMLLGSARIIAEQVHYEDDTLQLIVPPAALELFQSDSHDSVYYRISGPDRKLLAGSDDLPIVPIAPKSEESVYIDTVFRGEAVRLVAFSQPVFASPEHGPVLIEVAQTRGSYKVLAGQLWKHAVQQQLLILAAVVVLLWIGMRRGLAPIMKLRNTVQQREPNTLEPLDLAAVPYEMAPLANAMNDYVRRLEEHMAAHSRFIANASHQLRTPLTVLNTQLDYGLRSHDIESKNAALTAMRKGVRHGTRLVNQLLMLSMAEMSAGPPYEDVDLVAIVRGVLEDLASLAQSKAIDLGFECDDDSMMVRDKLSMLGELVSNLVDNALRYTPAGGIVTVSAKCRDDRVILRIEDNGPGIPEREYEHVFERFYRLHPENAEGSGLGLAIVREIATACDAEITLSAPLAHPGLIVTTVLSRR